MDAAAIRATLTRIPCTRNFAFPVERLLASTQEER